MQSVDQKKEEFQRYLEVSGVLESIVGVLVNLHEMPEKPRDARQFIHDYFTNSGTGEREALLKEIDELKRTVRCYGSLNARTHVDMASLATFSQVKEKDEQIKDLRELLEKRV
uniref:c-Myc-binding n=1 Tax=Lygus hesperus TaxID=30085 RepID=A0A0A9YSE5_LYGHE